MRKRKRLSYYELRNMEMFSVFPIMLDTQTIIVLCVLFYKKIHVSNCQSFLSVIVRSDDALCPALFLFVVNKVPYRSL